MWWRRRFRLRFGNLFQAARASSFLTIGATRVPRKNAHGIVGAEDGDGAGLSNSLGSRRRRSQNDSGRGGDELLAVVLANAENIEAHLVR
jgi:hypothetical protein